MDTPGLNAIDSVYAPGGAMPAPTGSLLTSRQVSFAELLGRHSGSGDTTLSAPERANATAEQLVSVALVQPLLAQLRASNNAAPPFAPTAAEKQMRALQDAELARQLTHAARFPLVERLAQHMLESSRRAGNAPAME